MRGRRGEREKMAEKMRDIIYNVDKRLHLVDNSKQNILP